MARVIDKHLPQSPLNLAIQKNMDAITGVNKIWIQYLEKKILKDKRYFT